MLWLALDFHRLALDTRPGAETHPEPLAIVSAQGARRIVVAANAAARAQGVRDGQALAAAQSLCAGLNTAARRPGDEAAALQNLSMWALRYSSQVARHDDRCLLIEIGASCRLFGGERALLHTIAHDLERDGYACAAGVGPTASAARLFAAAGHNRIVRDPTAIAEAIQTIDLDRGDLPEPVREALAGVGVRRYGALMRLPRGEVARRFGQHVHAHLDALLGHRAEALVPIRIAEQFRQRLEWPYPIHDHGALLFPARRLIVAAAHWLIACQRAVTRLRLSFKHEGHADTAIDLGLAQASADREHLIAVVRARLDSLTLPQGCTGLTLTLTETQPLDAPSRDLFVQHGEAPEEARQLLDRLQGRLGDHAVERFALNADHRPERSSRPAATFDTRTSNATKRNGKAAHDAHPADSGQRPSPRPMFLLPQPQPIGQWPGFDWRKSRLSLPERIESGWWDDADATRDYYRVDQADGARLWVFRNRRPPHDWFVQGIYA